MRYSRPLFFAAALLVSGSVCAGLWAKGAGARRVASVQPASAQRASGPDVAGYTLASSAQPTSAQRASGPGVAGYTLVTGISLGASSYCPRPGATVTLTATLSGSGNEKVTVSFNGAGTLPTCEAKPGDSCSVNYTAPSAESTVDVTASAKGSKPDAATQTSNKVSIVVAKKEWRAEPAIKGDIAAKVQQQGPLPTPTPTPVPGAQPVPPTAPTNPAPPAIPTGSRRFAPGSTVRVMATDAADEDTCSSCGEDEEETTPDEIKYNWTVGASGTESSAIVTMPASEGGTLEVKVEVEDKGEISGDAKGTRKDEKKMLSMTLYAAYPKPNDPDSDGDGIPDSEDDDPEPGPTPTPVPQPTATPGPNPTPTPKPPVFQPGSSQLYWRVLRPEDLEDGTKPSLDGTLGGTVAVQVIVQVGRKGRLSPTVNNFTVRLQEKDDDTNKVQHDPKDNHADFQFDLTDNHWAVWTSEEATTGTPPPPVLISRDGGNAKAENNTDHLSYFYTKTINWNTTQAIPTDLDGGGPRPGSSLLGHNGEHSVSVVEVNGQQSNSILFQKKMPDQTEWENAEFEAQETTHDVGNLVITRVSTSQESSDYIKFARVKRLHQIRSR